MLFSSLRRHLIFKTLLAFSIGLAIAGCQHQGSSTTEHSQQISDKTGSEGNSQSIKKQPNILLIIADDMGLTDLGAFGSEIDTPNLDSIANGGVKFTNFHASPQCAPTRSILMSGTDNHTAGMGTMFGTAFMEGELGDEPGYEGYLHPRVASLPERLKDAGYNTYMAGKWHLGETEEQKPTNRGFDEAFTLISGAANHMAMIGAGQRAPTYREHGEVLQSLPDDFFSADTYSEKMIEYIKVGSATDKPFFGYLALTSPHWPLQVPDDYKDLYKGRYDEGYDVLREERIKKAEALGVIAKVDPDLFQPIGKSWQELTPEEQRYTAREMELYASMVKNMDDNIGKITSYLEEIGELDNTLIFFMSDNGAEADSEENIFFGNTLKNNPYYDNSYENMGNVDSWVYYGPGWAQAAMAPYRLFKGYLTEGGTKVSAFMNHSSLTKSELINNHYLTVMDLMPTLLDVAGADFNPTEYAGREVEPMKGRSFASILQGSDQAVYSDTDIRPFELHGQRSLLQGNWKIIWEQEPMNIAWYGDEPDHWNSWRLFNLASDPTEQHDLSEQEPEKKAALIALWDQYAQDNYIRTNIVPVKGGAMGGPIGGNGGI